MKIIIALAYGALYLVSASQAFSIPPMARSGSLATLSMFGGAGGGVPTEDNPEEMLQMEQAAKSMGMSIEEYKLGMSARVRLTDELNASRVKGGDPSKVCVERDGNNPPKRIEITISDALKEMGKDAVSKELCSALKSAADESRKVRTEAQKGMMQFIQDEMKKMGKA